MVIEAQLFRYIFN